MEWAGLVLVGLIGEARSLFLEGGCHLGRVCLVLVLVGIGRHHLLVELVAVHIEILGRCIHAANRPADAGTHTAEFIGDGLGEGLLFVKFVDGLVGIFQEFAEGDIGGCFYGEGKVNIELVEEVLDILAVLLELGGLAVHFGGENIGCIGAEEGFNSGEDFTEFPDIVFLNAGFFFHHGLEVE